MQRITKALAAIMLMTATMFVAGCTEKPEQPAEEDIHLTEGEWIDLGLPSGLLWASCNVGATAPEEFGDYFAWGETRPKSSDSSLYNYKWWVIDSVGNVWLIKYCNVSDCGYNGFVDDLTVLESDDDAATANIGGGTRTPKKEEWQELIDNATFKWTTVNGVTGQLVKGKNGNSIFLPAAGDLEENVEGGGACGIYWKSSLSDVYPSCAWADFFGSDYGHLDYSLWRHKGISVRPVRSASYK